MLRLLESQGMELMVVPDDLVEGFEGVLDGRLFIDVSDTAESSWTELLEKLKDDEY